MDYMDHPFFNQTNCVKKTSPYKCHWALWTGVPSSPGMWLCCMFFFFLASFQKKWEKSKRKRNIHQVECEGVTDNDCDGGEHREILFLLFSQVFVGLPPGGRWLRPGDFRPVGVAQPGDEGSTCDDNQVVLGGGQRGGGGGGSVGAEGCLYATRALIYRQTPETEEFFLVWFSLFYYISEKKSQQRCSQNQRYWKCFTERIIFLSVDISLYTIWGSRFIWPELWVLPSVVCGVKKVGDWLGLSIVSTPPTVTTGNIKKKYEFRS